MMVFLLLVVPKDLFVVEQERLVERKIIMWEKLWNKRDVRFSVLQHSFFLFHRHFLYPFEKKINGGEKEERNSGANIGHLFYFLLRFFIATLRRGFQSCPKLMMSAWKLWAVVSFLQGRAHFQARKIIWTLVDNFETNETLL